MSIELSLAIVLAFVILGIASGVPIGYIFGIGTIILMLLSGNAGYLNWVVPATTKVLQGYTLLALPFYILVGNLLMTTGMSYKLFAFLRTLLGKTKGAFGGAIVVFVAVFGAISGSAAAAIAAIGSLVIPEGAHYGYDREYTTGLVACASLVAMLIPPSLTMIVFGVAGRLSIPILFLATAVPGILTSLFYIALNFFLIRRKGFNPAAQKPAISDKKEETATSPEGGLIGKAVAAWPSLMLPVIILGGIYGGVFTATEAAAVGCAWIIFYKLVASLSSAMKRKAASEIGAGINSITNGIIEAGKVIGALATIVFFLFALSRAMIFVNIPELIKQFLVTTIPNKYIFLLVVNVLLILMGMIMDDVSSCILAGIILLPVARYFGIDPFHFGAIVGVNAGMGNLTPPVAPNLYFAAGIGDVSVDLYPPNRYIKTVMVLLLLGQLPVLIMVTYIPEISLFLPNLWTG